MVGFLADAHGQPADTQAGGGLGLDLASINPLGRHLEQFSSVAHIQSFSPAPHKPQVVAYSTPNFLMSWLVSS